MPVAITGKISNKEHFMTHNTRRTKTFTLAFGLTMCLALMLSIMLTSATYKVYAAGEMPIDTLDVAFKKVDIGDNLAAAFEFEDEKAKTLKVPIGANYTATLIFISKNGQTITLWEKDNESFSWNRVANQLVEKNVAYCIRVNFSPKEGYTLSDDANTLKRKLKVSGAKLGKAKISNFGILPDKIR